MPFLTWSAFYYGFYAFLSLIAPNQLHVAVDCSLIGFFRGILFYEYAFPMWYMFQLCIYVFLLAPVVFYTMQRKPLKITLVVLIVLYCAYSRDGITVDLGNFERSIFQPNFFLYFLLGCYAVQNVSVLDKIQKLPTFVFAVLFVVFGCLESLFFDGLIPSSEPRCLVPLVSASFLVMMLKISDKLQVKHRSPVSTMIIYGIHPFAGLLLNKLLFSNMALSTVLLFVVRILAVAMLSFVLGYFLKYIKPLYRIFSGNR